MASSTTSAPASPAPPATCDAVIKIGRRAGKVCGRRARYYDPVRKHQLCGSHSYGSDNVRTGPGKSWYEDEKPKRVDGFNAAAPGDLCESGRHWWVARAKAIKNGVALCFNCSFDAELDDLHVFLAALNAEAA